MSPWYTLLVPHFRGLPTRAHRSGPPYLSARVAWSRTSCVTTGQVWALSPESHLSAMVCAPPKRARKAGTVESGPRPDVEIGIPLQSLAAGRIPKTPQRASPEICPQPIDKHVEPASLSCSNQHASLPRMPLGVRDNRILPPSSEWCQSKRREIAQIGSAPSKR